MIMYRPKTKRIEVIPPVAKAVRRAGIDDMIGPKTGMSSNMAANEAKEKRMRNSQNQQAKINKHAYDETKQKLAL